jgi:hypothetical protein
MALFRIVTSLSDRCQLPYLNINVHKVRGVLKMRLEILHMPEYLHSF